MRLREENDSHSVYVLYSDLLFNLLIVFLLVVLALVLRLNHGMNRLAQKQATPTTAPTTAPTPTPPDRSAEIKRLTDERNRSFRLAAELRQELTGLQQQLGALESQRADANARQKAELSRQLSIAAGANRFTGRTGGSSICVGVDYSGASVRYALINASDFNSAHSTLDGETPEMHAIRSARLLKNACRSATRFDIEDLKPLFAALRTRAVSDKTTDEGHVAFSFSKSASAAASGWLDADGDMDTRRAARDLMNWPNFISLDVTQSEAINKLIQLRDSTRRNETPDSVPVLHFADGGPNRLSLGGSTFSVQQFKEIIASFGEGGVILQYDAPPGEVCPPWIIRSVLTSVGYTNSVPDIDELRRLRAGLDANTR